MFAQIQAIPQPAEPALTGVTHASLYRRWGESEPLRDETALRDALQRIA